MKVIDRQIVKKQSIKLKVINRRITEIQSRRIEILEKRLRQMGVRAAFQDPLAVIVLQFVRSLKNASFGITGGEGGRVQTYLDVAVEARTITIGYEVTVTGYPTSPGILIIDKMVIGEPQRNLANLGRRTWTAP